MPRYKLTLEYDGSGFVGWQRQENGLSIQQALEEAVAGFCGEQVVAAGAGRTDAGVHALGQVAHIDLVREATPETIRDALNFHLKPAPIAVLLRGVGAGGLSRPFLGDGAALPLPHRQSAGAAGARSGPRLVGPQPLDAEAMATGAAFLVGRHDFTSFRASLCQAPSPVKTLDRLEVRRSGEEVVIEAGARSFLHHQVRNMVGSLKLVGEGKWTAEQIGRVLAARDRTAAGPTAPADGLALVEVRY